MGDTVSGMEIQFIFGELETGMGTGNESETQIKYEANINWLINLLKSELNELSWLHGLQMRASMFSLGLTPSGSPFFSLGRLQILPDCLAWQHDVSLFTWKVSYDNGGFF